MGQAVYLTFRFPCIVCTRGISGRKLKSLELTPGKGRPTAHYDPPPAFPFPASRAQVWFLCIEAKKGILGQGTREERTSEETCVALETVLADLTVLPIDETSRHHRRKRQKAKGKRVCRAFTRAALLLVEPPELRKG